MMRSFPINTKLLPVLLLFLFIAGSAAADGPKEINTEKGPHHRQKSLHEPEDRNRKSLTK